MSKVRLGDIAEVITKGTTPTSLGYKFEESGINFIKIESITESGSFISDKFAHISSECHYALKRSQLKKNDVLFSIAGAIGRVGIVDDTILPANTNQALAIIRIPDGAVDYNYLFYYLHSNSISRQYNRIKQGVAQINLSLKDISSFEIELPSIDEQRRIANTLDKVNTILLSDKKRLAKLDELIKSRFVEMFGDVRKNNKCFNQKLGKELFQFSSGKFLSEGNRLLEGFPVYGGNGIVWFTDLPLIEYPTIIIGRVGAWCGNIHRTNIPVWVTDNAIYIKNLNTDIYDLVFLEYLLKEMDFKNYADYSGQPKITQKPLLNLKYIIPPIDLQNQFADFVTKVEQQKATVQKSIEKLETLKKSLMQEYFG